MTRAKGRRREMSTPNQAINETPEVDDNGQTTLDLYNPHDGTKGRDGGPYLDHVLRQEAEINRARLEGREPDDLDGVLPADAGTPLWPAARIVDNSVMSNPSMANHPGFDVQPMSTADIDTRTDVPEDADVSEDAVVENDTVVENDESGYGV